MTDYEYDKNLPYVVEYLSEAVARFREFDEADAWAGGARNHRIINTNPKPRVPADAKFITWLVNGSARWFAERRIGSWSVDGATYDTLEDLPGVTPDTVFTVLDERQD